jgi:hypothetical protein
MTDFLTTTAFALVRRLAASGQETPSFYLLVSEDRAIDTVRAELAAEVEVQLGVKLRFVLASEMDPERLEDSLTTAGGVPITLITMDHWKPKVIDSLDGNIVWVTGAGTVLLLASFELAEQTLAAAPNMRNRFTDVLKIQLDEAFVGAKA